MTLESIQPQDLAGKLEANANLALVDVRTPAEFRQVHVRGAVNIPLDQLSDDAIRRAFPQISGDPIYFVCKSGVRGNMACEKIAATGKFNGVNVLRGTQGCEQAGLPVERGSAGGAIALERQVRIAAGSLVLLGVVLAVAVNPWCMGISAFVGAGLVFSGITDTCGMAMMLAKMPWNK